MISIQHPVSPRTSLVLFDNEGNGDDVPIASGVAEGTISILSSRCLKQRQNETHDCGIDGSSRGVLCITRTNELSTLFNEAVDGIVRAWSIYSESKLNPTHQFDGAMIYSGRDAQAKVGCESRSCAIHPGIMLFSIGRAI